MGLPFLLQSSLLANLDAAHIDCALLFRHILPWMGVGVIMGTGALLVAPGPLLKKGLGMWLLIASCMRLRMLLPPRGSKPLRSDVVAAEKAVPASGLFAAGLVQGMYGTRG